MKASQIRITKTPELEELLKTLQKYYFGLTENEIIKKVLSEDYRNKVPFVSDISVTIDSKLENELTDISNQVNSGSKSGPFDSIESINHLRQVQK